VLAKKEIAIAKGGNVAPKTAKAIIQLLKEKSRQGVAISLTTLQGLQKQ
jgi:ABC-type ATPase involved in cell division